MQIRVGTWNVLSSDDEYNDEYGCPLSIAMCRTDNEGTNGTTTSTTTTTTTTTTQQQQRRMECTQARYRRVWDRLEQIAPSLDVMALQEVVEAEFTPWQPIHSHWSRIDMMDATTDSSSNSSSSSSNNSSMDTGECSLWLSHYSNLTVTHTFTVELPSLSGCSAMPMALLSPSSSSSSHTAAATATETGTSPPPPTTTTTMNSSNIIGVGSVHVQASVTNMSEWFHISAGLIHTALAVATNGTVANNNNNDNVRLNNMVGWSWIVAGDFNHNLTEFGATATTSTRNNNNNTNAAEWQFVYDTDATADLCYGTSQKEDNWMGTFDGYWVSSPVIPHQSSIGSMNDTSISTTPTAAATTTTTMTNDTTSSLSFSTQVLRVQALVDGFMPKAVFHLPHGDAAPLQAQFAVVSTRAGDGIPVSRHRIEQWTTALDDTDDDDLHLVFSPSSNHSASSSYRVPHSNPRTQALSDHLMVTATFEVVSNDPNGTKQISTSPPPPTIVQSSSSTLNNLISGWMILVGSMAVVVAALVLSLVIRMRRQTQTRHSSRYGELCSNDAAE